MSLKGRIAARTSRERYVRHSLGFKAPRGWGWLTNPRKAAYNRVYNRSRGSLSSLFLPRRRRRSSGGIELAVLAVVAVVYVAVAAVTIVVRAVSFAVVFGHEFVKHWRERKRLAGPETSGELPSPADE